MHQVLLLIVPFIMWKKILKNLISMKMGDSISGQLDHTIRTHALILIINEIYHHTSLTTILSKFSKQLFHNQSVFHHYQTTRLIKPQYIFFKTKSLNLEKNQVLQINRVYFFHLQITILKT